MFSMAPNNIGYSSSRYRCVADAVEFRMDHAEAWATGVSYTLNYFVSWGSQKYKCIKAHTSRYGLEPPNSTTYWQIDNTVYKISIKPTELYNISSRGTKGFRCTNWYNRSFCDMQDDAGGQSKVLFFEIIGCEISNYLEDDCLGLLYGMGHAGLTMIGNSYPNYDDNDYGEYTTVLGSTSNNSFGRAYLVYANRDFNSPVDNFILFGAGTLKARSY